MGQAGMLQAHAAALISQQGKGKHGDACACTATHARYILHPRRTSHILDPGSTPTPTSYGGVALCSPT